VVVGRDPSDTGVYKGYANVGPLVTGVSGAILQGGFKTKGEAESYLSSVISLPTSATPTRRQNKTKQLMSIFITLSLDPHGDSRLTSRPKKGREKNGIRPVALRG
jgi:hypothetical protein